MWDTVSLRTMPQRTIQRAPVFFDVSLSPEGLLLEPRIISDLSLSGRLFQLPVRSELIRSPFEYLNRALSYVRDRPKYPPKSSGLHGSSRRTADHFLPLIHADNNQRPCFDLFVASVPSWNSILPLTRYPVRRTNQTGEKNCHDDRSLRLAVIHSRDVGISQATGHRN